jgi:hypothetical protein
MVLDRCYAHSGRSALSEVGCLCNILDATRLAKSAISFVTFPDMKKPSSRRCEKEKIPGGWTVLEDPEIESRRE